MDVEKGNFYHIYNRGNNSRKVFYTRQNYLFFLRKINESLSPYVSFIAWCLMPNHFHLVVYIHKTEIEIKDSEGISHTITSSDSMTRMRSLNYSLGVLLRSYTRAIQKQENFTGSLFQQHTQAKPLVDEVRIEPAYWDTTFGTQINISEGKSYLETCIEYIHQNPVYAGLVKKAEEWEFSSFQDYIGRRNGSLIDYEMIKKENLLPVNNDTLTQSESITKMNICIIGIGSNIDADSNIAKMIEILSNKVTVIKVSPMLITKPIGIKEQPDYTNGAVKIETELDRAQLNLVLKSIENQLGRNRKEPKFGTRTMDLDIVVWNGEIVDPDYYTRDFLEKSVNAVW